MTLSDWAKRQYYVTGRPTSIKDVLGVASGPIPQDLVVAPATGNVASRRPTLQCDSVLTNRVDGLIWNDGLTTLQHRCYADLLPLNGNLK
jgi:hypothetical protein